MSSVKAKIRQVNEKENQRCFNCHSLGHFSTECPEPQMTLCYNCREQGHKTFECPRTVSCRSCGQVGHKERQCRVKKSNSGADSVTTANTVQDRWGGMMDLDVPSPSSLGKKAVKLQLNTPHKDCSNGLPAPPPPPPPGLPSPTQWVFDQITTAPDKLSSLSSKSTSQTLGPPASDIPPATQLDDSSILQGLLSAYLSVASTPTNASTMYNLRQQPSNEMTSDSSDYQTPHQSEKSMLSFKSRYARSETTAADKLSEFASDSAIFQQMRWRSSSAIPDPLPRAGHRHQASVDNETFSYAFDPYHRKGRTQGATEGTRRPTPFRDGSARDGRLSPSTSLSYSGINKGLSAELKSPPCLATSTRATTGSRSTMAATPIERSSFRHSTSNSRHISWNKSVNQAFSKDFNQTPSTSFSSSHLEASRLASSLPSLPTPRPDDTCSSQYALRAQSSLVDDLDVEASARSMSCLSGRQSSFCLELNSNRLYSPSSPIAPTLPSLDSLMSSSMLMTIAMGQDPYLIAYSEPVTTDYPHGQGEIPNEQASKYVAPCSVVGRPMWLLNAAALFTSDVGDPWRPWPSTLHESSSYAPFKRYGGVPGNIAATAAPSDRCPIAPSQQGENTSSRGHWQTDVYMSQPPVVVAVQAPREEESPNLTDDLCQDIQITTQELEPASSAPQNVGKSNTRLRLPASPSTFSVASAPSIQRYHGSMSPSPALRPSATSSTSWLTTGAQVS